MAGFEVIVRPVVFPAIRPAPARPLAPQDDPEKGVAVLSGLGGKLIDLSFSESASWSKSRPVETRRNVATERIYQKKPPTPEHPKGELEKENYIDVERMRRLEMQEGDGTKKLYYYADPPMPRDFNIEVLEPDKWILNPTQPAPPDGGGAAP
jgi:hypothetical protein